MAGRFKALTWAQEPRCSRQDSPAFAACPQGFLSSAMAVPHNDSSRRKAAASLVLALLAASNALMDAAVNAAVVVDAGPPDTVAGGVTVTRIGAAAGVGRAVVCGLLPKARKGEICLCHICQPQKAATAMLTSPSAPASQPS